MMTFYHHQCIIANIINKLKRSVNYIADLLFHKTTASLFLRYLGAVAGDLSEEVLGLLPRVLVAEHIGTHDLTAYLVLAEDTVDLVHSGVGVIALGLDNRQVQIALEIGLVDGVQEGVVACRKFLVALVLGTDLLILDAGTEMVAAPEEASSRSRLLAKK